MKDERQSHENNTPTNMRLDVVYVDKKFQKSASSFKSNLIIYLIKNKFLKSPKDFTFCNKTIIDKVCDEDILNQYNMIIQDFPINDNELWTYLGLNTEPDKDYPISIVFESNKYLTVNIHPWAKKQDLIDSWRKIEELLKTREGYAKRLRGPKDIGLIYAISKARQKKMTFKNIADTINKNCLEDYKVPKNYTRVWNESELIDYYNRYKHLVNK